MRDRPQFILDVETQELGITAGLMDRVAQVREARSTRALTRAASELPQQSIALSCRSTHRASDSAWRRGLRCTPAPAGLWRRGLPGRARVRRGSLAQRR